MSGKEKREREGDSDSAVAISKELCMGGNSRCKRIWKYI